MWSKGVVKAEFGLDIMENFPVRSEAISWQASMLSSGKPFFYARNASGMMLMGCVVGMR